MALCDAQSGLRLTTENTLVHALAPVVYDVVVEQAERVVAQSTLELTDGPLGYSPLAANSTRRLPIFQPIKDGQPFEFRQWLAVGSARGLFARSFSNSSAIGGFFLVGGIPLWAVLNVILCPSRVA